MKRNPGRIEIIDEQMARVLRAKTGAERLAIANQMFIDARAMIRNHLRSEHPDWSDDQINVETARRISHGAV